VLQRLQQPGAREASTSPAEPSADVPTERDSQKAQAAQEVA